MQSAELESSVQERILIREATLKCVVKSFLVLSSFVRSMGAYRSQMGNEAADQKLFELHQIFLQDLSSFELSIKKVRAAEQVCEQELAASDEQRRATQADVARVRDEISALADELARERVNRTHKEEYTALAKVIGEHDKRSVLAAAIAREEAALRALDAEEAALEMALELRGKQFRVLLQALRSLTGMIEAEDKEKEAKEKK